MWDLPRPGLEPVSPALAGRFSTTVPPGKPQDYFLKKASALPPVCSPAFMLRCCRSCHFVFLCFKACKGPSVNITEFLQSRHPPEKLSFNDWLLTSPCQKPDVYGCSEGQRNALFVPLDFMSSVSASSYTLRQYEFMI